MWTLYVGQIDVWRSVCGGEANVERHDSEDAPPLKFFDAQPVYGKKAVVVHIQPESETQCSVLFGGSTWSRRKKRQLRL